MRTGGVDAGRPANGSRGDVAIEVVFFDVGGVLLEQDKARVLATWDKRLGLPAGTCDTYLAKYYEDAQTRPARPSDYPEFPYLEEMIQSIGRTDKLVPGMESILERVRVDPTRAAMIDDQEKNIRSAASIGMAAILFQSADQLRRRLREIGLVF